MNIELVVAWVSSKANPADAPSRSEPLPQWTERPAWSQPLWLQVPRLERKRGVRGGQTPIAQNVPTDVCVAVEGRRLGTRYLPSQADDVVGACCQKFDAGTGHLSAGLRRRGLSTIEYELFKAGECDPLADMTSDAVIDGKILAAKQGPIAYAHVGIICSSWGIINRIWNGGIRTADRPYGNGTLERAKCATCNLLR